MEKKVYFEAINFEVEGGVFGGEKRIKNVVDDGVREF